MQLRFLLDENISPAVARALRLEGMDVQHLQEVGLKGASDPAVLEAAVEDRRVLLTANIWDFKKLAETHHHAGIVSLPTAQMGRAEQIALIRDLLPQVTVYEDLSDQILTFDRTGNLTIRRLPADPVPGDAP